MNVPIQAIYGIARQDIEKLKDEGIYYTNELLHACRTAEGRQELLEASGGAPFQVGDLLRKARILSLHMEIMGLLLRPGELIYVETESSENESSPS